jgi:hypothetical protein
MRDWVKRNWRELIVFGLMALGGAMLAGSMFCDLRTAYAQKPRPTPEENCRWVAQHCKGNVCPYSDYYSAICISDAAQKPVEQPAIKVTNGTSLGAFRSESKEYTFTAGGTRIGVMDAHGNFTLTNQAFWKMVEQHCVAVITEKQTVHHKIGPSGPSYDDRMEWDEDVPEVTRKLRCRPDATESKP